MTSRGVKRKYQKDEDEGEKEKKAKTIDERVARFFGGGGSDDDDAKSGGVYEPQTQLEKESKAASRQGGMRHASQKNYFKVLGLQTPESRAFCMNVFMFFTPRERLNLLMKFWRVWHDHFSKEKLPWRWVTTYAMRPSSDMFIQYPIPEHMYKFMSECVDTTISDRATWLYDPVSKHAAFYFNWKCL